jgi:hypothetical protein
MNLFQLGVFVVDVAGAVVVVVAFELEEVFQEGTFGSAVDFGFSSFLAADADEPYVEVDPDDP